LFWLAGINTSNVIRMTNETGINTSGFGIFSVKGGKLVTGYMLTPAHPHNGSPGLVGVLSSLEAMYGRYITL
jgi:hypothetical protein